MLCKYLERYEAVPASIAYKTLSKLQAAGCPRPGGTSDITHKTGLAFGALTWHVYFHLPSDVLTPSTTTISYEGSIDEVHIIKTE